MTIDEAFGSGGLEIERNTSTEKQIAHLKKNISTLKAERDEWKARAEKAEELVKIFEDGSKSIETKLAKAEAERDEWQDKAGWSYAEGWTARATLEDKEIIELRAERDGYKAALENIATSFPTSLALNGAAYMSSADTTKMRNNHMIIAQQALAGKE